MVASCYVCLYKTENKSYPPRLHINWQPGSTTPNTQLHQATPTTMDADTLPTILSAQATAQGKMLQAVRKEMQGMFSSMTSTSTTAHATSAEFVTHSRLLHGCPNSRTTRKMAVSLTSGTAATRI
uniref:Uncharacterized protein n=1 Tax=Haemonchus contortus TaxID=6289 RepID=A0A7I4XV27_HAECO